MAERRIRGTVAGTVQGVGFRFSARAEAERLGVAGWVRNLPDGRVAFEAEGRADDVDAFEAWLRHGPAGAAVDRAEIESAEITGERGFRIVH